MRLAIQRLTLGLLLFMSARLARSEVFSLGIKGGFLLTDPLITGSGGAGGITHEVRRYLVGATGEVHLPLRFSFEVDALYRPLSYTVIPNNMPAGRITGSDWQFPSLVKYQFREGVVFHPFVDAGVTLRHVSFSEIANPNTAGISAGGGITLKLLFLRLSPEVRYTHFSTNKFGNNFNFISSTGNQADFLVGLTF